MNNNIMTSYADFDGDVRYLNLATVTVGSIITKCCPATESAELRKHAEDNVAQLRRLLEQAEAHLAEFT